MDASPSLPAGSLPSASIDDIRHVVVFAKVAESGSFAAAAKALGLSTATTSQHVTRLESRLGAALLYRNTRKLSLTDDGARLLETAQSMLALYEQGLLGFNSRSYAGAQLRIALPAVLLRSALLPALAECMREHAEVRFHLHSTDTRSDLIGENIDLAFRIGDLADSGLRARTLFQLRRCVVASPKLWGGCSPPSHPRELAELPWIGLSMRAHQRRFVRDDGEEFAFRYTPRLQVDSVELAYELAKQGLGLAAPPDFLFESDPGRAKLLQVLPEWSLPSLPVHALWPGNLPRGSLVHTVIEALAEGLRT
jgi:DNA-binding transcriptional LysR family regulator